MVETIQLIAILAAVSMLGYGLWLIHPAAMWIGIGFLILIGVVASRLLKGRAHARRNS